jgi:hypothetical protein
MSPQPSPVDQQTPNEGFILSRVTIDEFHYGKIFKKFAMGDESGGRDSLSPQSRGRSRSDGSYPNRLERYHLCEKVTSEQNRNT